MSERSRENRFLSWMGHRRKKLQCGGRRPRENLRFLYRFMKEKKKKKFSWLFSHDLNLTLLDESNLKHISETKLKTRWKLEAETLKVLLDLFLKHERFLDLLPAGKIRSAASGFSLLPRKKYNKVSLPLSSREGTKPQTCLLNKQHLFERFSTLFL